jgi:hypothetical protein
MYKLKLVTKGQIERTPSAEVRNVERGFEVFAGNSQYSYKTFQDAYQRASEEASSGKHYLVTLGGCKMAKDYLWAEK